MWFRATRGGRFSLPPALGNYFRGPSLKGGRRARCLTRFLTHGGAPGSILVFSGEATQHIVTKMWCFSAAIKKGKSSHREKIRGKSPPLSYGVVKTGVFFPVIRATRHFNIL